jgi:hypothetical protein
MIYLKLKGVSNIEFKFPAEKGITKAEIRNENIRKSWRTNRQGLKWQLVEADDFDGWPAGATRRKLPGGHCRKRNLRNN